MVTIDFNEILQELKNAVELLAKQTISDYWEEAADDADQFFQRMK